MPFYNHLLFDCKYLHILTVFLYSQDGLDVSLNINTIVFFASTKIGVPKIRSKKGLQATKLMIFICPYMGIKPPYAHIWAYEYP